MSQDLDEDHYYKSKGGMIPVKWTAPEAVLYKKYTTKSDVWSYGMVMYEIWSLGHKPFEDVSVEEVCVCVVTRWSKIMLQCYEYLNVFSCLTFNYVHANTLCVLLQVIRVFGSGFCLSPPPGCPRGVYLLMVECW